MHQFEEPSEGGDRFTVEDAQNKRLIVVPIEHVSQIQTAYGTNDAIRVNVVDLDDPNGPAVYFGALWFGRIVGTFRSSIGKTLLGFIAKGRTQGGFMGWQFHSLTQDQYTVQVANAFLQQHPDFLQTCEGDVNMAKQQTSMGSDPWQTTAPSQGPPAAPQPQAPPQTQPLAPAPPQAPIPPQAPPQAPPIPQSGPQPLPPPQANVTEQARGLVQNQLGGVPVQDPNQASAPPPAPDNRSVMERLRARREDQEQIQQSQEQYPF